MTVRLGTATVADEAIVSIVRGAVAGVPGARLDLPGRVSRVLPGRRCPVEWVVTGGTIAFDVDVCAGYGRVLPQLAGTVHSFIGTEREHAALLDKLDPVSPLYPALAGQLPR